MSRHLAAMLDSSALGLSLVLAENSGALAGLVITRPVLKAGVGDSVLLKCFFQSLVPGVWNVTKVDWIRTPENNTQEEMVFYYYSNHSVPVGRFRHRVQWMGDVAHKDGSVRLQDVQMDDSGTYACEIRVFGRSSIFKNYTVLRVAYEGQEWSGFVDSESTSSWWVALASICVTAFLALVLLGLGLKALLQRQRAAVSRTPASSQAGAEEGIYFSVPNAEVLKAGQEAEQQGRMDATYVTMYPLAAFQKAGLTVLESNVYVQLARKAMPGEWRNEGRWGTEGAPGSKQACEKASWPEEEFRGARCEGRAALSAAEHDSQGR
ncbi:junctional adhesion molecule-like [Carettochelys insculpta]|uniref:junctional adhesion molecule-like n=1 Tax=Carettochelys insculpta TaxID=44489 RepID=UPI003EB8D50E